MPPGRQILRTMSPKRPRHSEDEDKSGLERKPSLSRRSNSLRGLRFLHKTHEAPSASEEETFKREWGMTMAQEVCHIKSKTLAPPLLVLGFLQRKGAFLHDAFCSVDGCIDEKHPFIAAERTPEEVQGPAEGCRHPQQAHRQATGLSHTWSLLAHCSSCTSWCSESH